ncbi:MAG TPA: hypothetical protein VL991_04315 [Terracidiphilus sp.]|jgi:hypothetical protein|nr:hypothetical protein [Terracidiphilus sp.]
MKKNGSKVLVELQAAGALKAVLQQVSGVRLREIKLEPFRPGHQREIVASIDVFGRQRTLTCAVASDATEPQISKALLDLRRNATPGPGGTTFVLIAPQMPSASAIYDANKVGFVDFQGNAHLNLGEAFIWKHTVPFQDVHPS